MDRYGVAADRASRVITETFSSSFGSAIRLLDIGIRQDIYNIYGAVRIADEIVDTHQGNDAEHLLNSLEKEIYSALKTGFSSNVIVHAFSKTAKHYDIPEELIEPFFSSMRMDLTIKRHTEESYKKYIYGSAEVVGLMCLKVFTLDDAAQYERLSDGACALGAAYQKVNFLRDIKDDYEIRGRFYFPHTTYQLFDEKQKAGIVTDIYTDLEKAQHAIRMLPKKASYATQLSHDYYKELLRMLDKTPVEILREERLSVAKSSKLRYLLRAKVGQYVS